MKRFVCAVAAVLLMAADVLAQGQVCPADRAASKGYPEFEAFHKIVAPAWHNFYVNKEYDSLLAAGPKFKEAFAGIAKMQPKFKLDSRKEDFLRERERLRSMVDKYASAAAKNDKEAVYKLLPELHDAFEQSSAALLPLTYSLIEGLVVTKDMILEKHLPDSNMQGIIGSTSTLLSKIETFSPDSIPKELRPAKAGIVEAIGLMKTTIAQMQTCIEKNDMEEYKKTLSQLDQQLDQFIEKYL